MDYLTKKLFGKSSEKRSEVPGQLSLFNEAETLQAPVKNWLFSDTPNGAEASSLVYTMVETAKANGVNPYRYLEYLLEKYPSDRMSDEKLEELSPWNADVKAAIREKTEAFMAGISLLGESGSNLYHM